MLDMSPKRRFNLRQNIRRWLPTAIHMFLQLKLSMRKMRILRPLLLHHLQIWKNRRRSTLLQLRSSRRTRYLKPQQGLFCYLRMNSSLHLSRLKTSISSLHWWIGCRHNRQELFSESHKSRNFMIVLEHFAQNLRARMERQ